MAATVPTSKRSSPPPTSEPREMRTMPTALAREAVGDQCAVPGLEDVQGQPVVGEEHRGHGEHRQSTLVGHAHRMPRSRWGRVAVRYQPTLRGRTSRNLDQRCD